MTWWSGSCTTLRHPPEDLAGRPVRLAVVEQLPAQIYPIAEDSEANDRGEGRHEVRPSSHVLTSNAAAISESPATTAWVDRRFRLLIPAGRRI
jgi:hypothetical protein